MNDRRRDPRSRPPMEFNPRRHPPNDMPLHPETAPGWRPARPESRPYLSSAMFARQPWRDPRADGNMDFDPRPSEHPRRLPSPRSERRPPFRGTMLGDGGGDHRRPYPDECDELSLESYDYRPGRHGDPEWFAASSSRPRRPLSPPPFDTGHERPFGYEDRPRPFFGPSRPHREEEPFGIPEGIRDRPFGPHSPHGGRPRFSREAELGAPLGAPSIRPGDGDRRHLQPPERRGTPPNAGSWRPRPFGLENSRGVGEDRADSLQLREGWREPWHPGRRGPNRDDLRGTNEECSPPPHYRQRPEGFMDLDQRPSSSSEHQNWDRRQRAKSDYCEQSAMHADYDRWDSHPSELQERGQQRPNAPYCDERSASFSGVRGSPFHPSQFEGSSRGRPVPADQERLPEMRGPREPCIPRDVSQNSSRDSHSGSVYEERQMPDKYGTRPAMSNIESRGDANRGAAPDRQERPTNPNPPLLNLQKIHKQEETAKPELQELPCNTDSYGWSKRRNSGEADPRHSGVHERAVDAGCPWPNLPKIGEDRPVSSDRLQGLINPECMPLGFTGIQVGSQGLPATSIPPVQLSSTEITPRAPSGPITSQPARNAGQSESDSGQQLPISVKQQQQSLPVRSLLPSAPTDNIRQRPQSTSPIGSVPQLPTQSTPQKPPASCLDNVDRPLGVTEVGVFKEEKSSIPIDRKLEPPPSPPWLRGPKELGYPELRPSLQEQVAKGDNTGGPHCQMGSRGNGKKPGPVAQHLPQNTSDSSCGPRQSYGPNYPEGGRQPLVPESGPKAASLATVSLLPEQPSASSPIFAAPQQTATASANVAQLDISASTPLKSQELRPLTTAYPKVRFSLPSPLLAQGQARFPAPANQEGTRACAPHVSMSHAKSGTSGDAKHQAVSPAVQGKPGYHPSEEKRNLDPPPGIPSYFTGSQQGSETATSVSQPAVCPSSFQGEHAATSSNQKQLSPAPDGQGQVESALSSSKLVGSVGKLKQGMSKSPSIFYGPKVPNPTAAIQWASTDAQSSNSEVEMMDIDADGPVLSVKSSKADASAGQSTLPMKRVANQPVLTAANQADASRKNEIQSQNTGPQNINAGVKKQQPLIMKRAANLVKKTAELKNAKPEPKKREVAVEDNGSLTKCDAGNADPPKPSNVTGEPPLKEYGSGLKNAEEDMGIKGALVTKEKTTPVIEEEALNSEELAEKSDEILALDESETMTNNETPSSTDSMVNDQEVSSSTPECSDEATSAGEGKTADTSNEPSATSTVTAGGGDKCDKKRKLSQGSDSPVTKRDVTSDSEQSEYSNSKKTARPRSPSPKTASARAGHTYSSEDDYAYTDSETRNDPICLSGRGSEGQIFGIPVVFKAMSSTRNFWNIRGSQVSRELEEVVGENVVNQKINRAGFLCVNVATAGDAVKLLNVTKLGGVNVEAVIPSMYLRHEAKIRGVPYHFTNEQLTEYFSDVGVVGARRQLTVKRLHDGSFEEYPRSSVILTFKPDATLPKTLELGPDRFIVEEYIEAPLQCFKCLRFGHTARDCVSVGRCKNCGARYCLEDCERRTPMCANCFGPHPATYVGCPRRREVAFASLWKKAFDLNAL